MIKKIFKFSFMLNRMEMTNPYLKSDKKICKFVSITKTTKDNYIFKIIDENGHIQPSDPTIFYTLDSLSESEEIMFYKELTNLKFFMKISDQLRELFNSSLNPVIIGKRESFKKYILDDFNRIYIMIENHFNTKICIRLEFHWREDQTCQIDIVCLDSISKGIFEEVYAVGRNR